MEDALAIFALIGIVLLVCAILVLGGAFLWPKITEAIVENFYISPGYGSHRCINCFQEMCACGQDRDDVKL
ncbi:MAG: hypothetical protein J6U66_13270 [Lachnospiraceae bacterium]|nr:hypothetical protein [Lachnospiraceae bacterium]